MDRQLYHLPSLWLSRSERAHLATLRCSPDTHCWEVDMVRNLMLIVGVSVSLATFGCSDDGGSAGSGGSAGTGGTAGSGGGTAGSGGGGGMVTDACLSSADLTMVCMSDFGDNYIAPCATEASGAAAGTSACLQEDPPALSADCADCLGAQVECIRDNCVLGANNACFPPIADQDACDQCAADAGCTAAADACTGDLSTACAG
jgi:hypothetical protein